MGLPDLSGSNIQDTYQRVLHTSGGAIFDGTGSTVPISFNGDNVTVAGTITAQTYVVSESVVNVSSGSTIFGNSSDDTHTFTGDITASGDIYLEENKKIYFDGGDNPENTYIYKNGTSMDFRVSTAQRLTLGTSETVFNNNSVRIGANSDPQNLHVTGDMSASGNIYGNLTADTDNSVVIYKNGRLYTDEIDSRVWGSTLLDSTDTAACADKIKTIQCAVTDAPRYLTFVDDNNSSADCETLRTNENIFWNCRTRVLTVNGAIKSKGSDITLMSGSISASGAITASNVSMSGDMIATTGSFNHIITDGDTIEFRQAGTTTKLV